MTTPTAPFLRMTAAAAGEIRTALAAAGDEEPCGYLVGSVDPARGWCAEFVWAGSNTHPTPGTAFGLEPDEQLAMRRRARRDGLDLVGIWHGHLAGPARPGRADREGIGAFAPPIMLIAGWESGAIVLRAYVPSPPAWRELAIEVTTAADA